MEICRALEKRKRETGKRVREFGMEEKKTFIATLTDEEDECLFYFRQLSDNGRRCALWQLNHFVLYEKKQKEQKDKNIVYPELKVWGEKQSQKRITPGPYSPGV